VNGSGDRRYTIDSSFKDVTGLEEQPKVLHKLLLAAVTIDGFDLFAFLVLAVLLATAVVIVVFLGGLPGRIARSSNHPYAKAINAAGWISLVTLGALWPIAFVWAFMSPLPKPSVIEENDSQ
jgi:hypothetical protein